MTREPRRAAGTTISRPRTILVTGGANGLGAAMVRRFTTAGDRVAAADIDTAAGRQLADSTGCLFVTTDVASYVDNQAAVEAVVARFGGLDAVCLNAGVPGATTVGESFDPDRYRSAMGVNLDGAVYGLNAAIPSLRAGGGGSILLTSSLAGIAPALDAYYCAAKHALIGLALSFAMILRNDHITVNALCPGFIDTRLVAGIRTALCAYGIAVADADQVAATAAAILDEPNTGQVWEVQADQPAKPVGFPDLTLSRTAVSPYTGIPEKG
jgi:NAD(P)-dependent dehydrogenase (short-subunit alcohol dehydrogenase family)